MSQKSKERKKEKKRWFETRGEFENITKQKRLETFREKQRRNSSGSERCGETFTVKENWKSSRTGKGQNVEGKKRERTRTKFDRKSAPLFQDLLGDEMKRKES